MSVSSLMREARRERSNARLLKAYAKIMLACEEALVGTPDADTLHAVSETLNREGTCLKLDAQQYIIRARQLEEQAEIAKRREGSK